MPINEIEELKNQLVKLLSPIRIYLFGSFAKGTNSKNSDFDFYIVVGDEVTDLVEMTVGAYKAIRTMKQRSVDIIVGTSTLSLKFLCKFSRIFFRVCKFRNGGVAGYAEYSGVVQSGK